MSTDEALRRAREDVCVGHMTAENAHEFDDAIAFFARPRYEIVATGEVYDGTERLHDLMRENVTAFPDFRYDVEHLHHADDAVVVEGTFLGTHLGTWRGLPATGRRVGFPMLIVFPFEEDRMLGERIYFDLSTALRQLGVARDPNTVTGRIATVLNHPVTVGGAVWRQVAAPRARPRGTAPLPPGSSGLPMIGETTSFLRDPFTFLEERHRRYGDVFRSNVLGRRVAFLAGVEGAEAFYDPEVITREDAHPFTLRAMFGGRNMEMFDGPRHRALKTMSLTAFGNEAIESYLPDMSALIRTRWAEIVAGGRRLATVPILKHLAIEAIWGSVMGRSERGEANEITHEYDDVVTGVTSIPVPLAGTTFRRATAARDRLLDRIRREIAERRARPTDDGLSRMLAATTPGAEPMTDREALLEVHHIVVAGFIVYLLMAEVLRRLAEDPALLERCEDEITKQVPGATPTVDELDRLTACRSVVDEAKRLVPIVPLAFGRAKRGFRCGGFEVPEGWTVYLALHLINHDPRLFEEPDRFDPDRFGTDRAEHRRHPMAFIPQGAAPTGHRCLGVDYSTAIVLVFMVELLRGYRWTLPPQDLGLDRRMVPPEPRDQLLVDIRPRTASDG